MGRQLDWGGRALQGHIRRRAPSGSWEYILDVGRYGAQRCQGCGKRFWIERRPKERCPACGGEAYMRGPQITYTCAQCGHTEVTKVWVGTSGG